MVAQVAASTLLLEITLTRLFSVLLLNHFSFFVVALAMSGLALGGLWMARQPVERESEAAFGGRLAVLALLGSTAVLTGLALLLVVPEGVLPLSHLPAIAVFTVAFTACGAILAAAFARQPAWIGALYASDLVAAAAACIATIAVLRRIQGPAALLVPAFVLALAAALYDPIRLRRAGAIVLAVTVGGLVLFAATAPEPILRFRRATSAGTVVFERWNDYSRIQGVAGEMPDRIWFTIDRAASTRMDRILPREGTSVPASEPSWMEGYQTLAYHTGRPFHRVAVIGVGGGRDLLAPLQLGVPEIIGYDLNRIFIDLLERDFAGFNTIARRPEVTLIHSEARTGLRREPGRFDVIQASLVDTWAATAAGGFVLAENGLYTLEGWRLFLDRLTPTGILTMTRWYVPQAPAEVQRLVALAATAVEAAGMGEPRRHIAVAVTASPEAIDPILGPIGVATILVSKTPFTPDELSRLRAAPIDRPVRLLIDPERAPDDTVLTALLANDTRAAAVEASPFDISAPTDMRPYFFLLLRPGSLLLFDRSYGGGTASVMFNGVRILMAMVAWASLLALGVLWLGTRAPGSSRPAQGMAAGTGYFLGIGLGYMLVQIGLHQRLTLLLGQPTYALSVVLFGLLLGTGLGAAAAARLAPPGRELRAWVLLLGAVAATAMLLPAAPRLDELGAAWLRLLVVVTFLIGLGATLGTAFPIGVKIMAPRGSGVVQRMWAINGAASIAGSALAALIGLAAGSRVVILAGLGCYAVAVACGWAARGRSNARTG